MSADGVRGSTAAGLRDRASAARPRRAGVSGPAEQSCPVGALSELPNVMREAGHDPWELLESFGVSESMMAEPATPTPLALHGQILQAAADATGREDLGLLFGQRSTMANAGPLRLLVFNSRTAREAIAALVRYHGLWFHGVRLELATDHGFASVSVSVEGQFPGRDHVLTAYLAAAVKHLEEIFPRSWRPSQVHISYRRPRLAENYARFFRAPVLFDQPRHAVLFPEAALDETRPGSQQMLDRFLRQYLGELESRVQPDFIARVRQVIESLLATGDCTIVRVAEMFSIHRVTMHRYLQEYGMTFEQLLDESRRKLAATMLEETDLPIGEIALALGYGSPGSFVRAYKRWHGVTPGASRSRRPEIGRAASRVQITARRS